MKSKTILAAVALCSVALLSGCSHSLPANDVRLKLDECTNAQLDNIVYMRADKSVLNVVCTPKPDEIVNPVTVNHPLFFWLSPSHQKPTVPPLKVS